MNTTTLTNEQRERAKTILQRLSDNEIEKPKDIVERWERMPAYDELNTEDDVFEMELPRERKYVSVSDIIGTGAGGGADYLQQERLKNVLELLLAGEFKQKHEQPPKLEGVNGDYYVAVDGVHRVLAFKAVGLDEIYAEVIEIPVE